MDTFELSIVNKVSELEKVAATLEELSARWAIASKVTMQLNLVLEELVTNVMFHGHQDGQEHVISIAFSRNERVLSVVVTDDAPAFNLLEHPDDSRVDQPLEERKIGGLGIRFVKTVMDRVEYVRRDGKNVVTLTKTY
jgi:anti-sigma regulatory factor (Ser/Thr protein kinase)